MIAEKNSTSAVWTVYYQAPGELDVFTERTTELEPTVARLEAAGYVVIDEIME